MTVDKMVEWHHRDSMDMSLSKLWEMVKDRLKGLRDREIIWKMYLYLYYTWIAGGSNQSTLKEINPEYSLEGLMLKLKLQYFGLLMQRIDSLEKTLMLGKTEGRKRRE